MTGAKPFDQPVITDWDSINDGLRFKQCVRDRIVDKNDPLQQFVVSDDESKEMEDILAQFSPKQRKRIMKYKKIKNLFEFLIFYRKLSKAERKEKYRKLSDETQNIRRKSNDEEEEGSKHRERSLSEKKRHKERRKHESSVGSSRKIRSEESHEKGTVYKNRERKRKREKHDKHKSKHRRHSTSESSNDEQWVEK